MSLEPSQPPASRRRTRAAERAFVLLLCGCVLLLPPGAQIFQIEGRIGGIPAALAVLFVLWAALIVGARFCARALADAGSGEDAGQ